MQWLGGAAYFSKRKAHTERERPAQPKGILHHSTTRSHLSLVSCQGSGQSKLLWFLITLKEEPRKRTIKIRAANENTNGRVQGGNGSLPSSRASNPHFWQQFQSYIHIYSKETSAQEHKSWANPYYTYTHSSSHVSRKQPKYSSYSYIHITKYSYNQILSIRESTKNLRATKQY